MTSYHTAPSALPERAVRELAAATAALVREHDVIGTTINLLAGCAECVQATAAGIVVVQPGREGLEFLAATDHRAQHLEVYQVQIDNGPGVDCVATGQSVTVVGTEAIGARWPTLLEAFRAAGFSGVHAAPMIWQGSMLGAVNLFFAEGGLADDAELIAQAFADIAALVIAQTTALSPAELAARTRAALEERTVIERAKGVLAYAEGLSMDAAFDQLVTRARIQAIPLTAMAAAVVHAAANGDRQGQ
ncbi:GAF and ANTAR domain-containing protein [Kribbella sp. NPDC026611]|uniref:GAF and ANTAR domain-containing protein n=1 Tax=Kribbella sp. NPDC026611 TaxID=3154911 RepID=UPI0033EF781A